MEVLINFVQRYEILLLISLLALIYIIVIIMCLRHVTRNESLTREQKKKWIWHLIHWNVFAIPVYWKKHMLVRKH